jgi:hypothetical protein
MYKLVFSILSFFLLSCDKGLAPLPPEQLAEISGHVHFIGVPTDSVKILAVVLVQPIPPYATSTIISGINTIVFPYALSPSTFKDTTYSFTVKPDTTYHYLGVAQNFGDLFKDWRVVGFIHDDKDSAISFTLKPGEHRDSVDIIVHFDSIPRQPFIK